MSNNIYSIYKVTNLINNKIYIGKTNNFHRRCRDHLSANGDSYLYRAIRKYGKQNFKFEEIFITFTESDLSYFEKHFIVEFNTNISSGGIGYNMTSGGEGFDSVSARIALQKRIENKTNPWSGEHGSKLTKDRASKGELWSQSSEGKEVLSKLTKERMDIYFSDKTKDEKREYAKHLLHKNLTKEQQDRKIQNWHNTMNSQPAAKILKAKEKSKTTIANRTEADNLRRILKAKETVSNRTEEEKLAYSQKMSKALKGKPKPIFTCPKCGCSGNVGSMKRWGHGETCEKDPNNFRGKTLI